MKPSTRAIVAMTWLALTPALAAGQELDPGTWSGSITNNSGQNRNSRPAALEVKLIPDPHWQWRSGPREIRSIVFTAVNRSFEVSGATLEAGTLSFSFTDSERDDRVRCTLKRQPDGSYEGDCVGGGRRHLILRPPDAPGA